MGVVHLINKNPGHPGIGTGGKRYAFRVMAGLTFVSCGLFGGDDKEPLSLEDTRLVLEYIEAEQGDVYPGEVEGRWVASHPHTFLNFFEGDSVTNIPPPNPFIRLPYYYDGSYSFYAKNGLDINWWSCAHVGRTSLVPISIFTILAMIDSITSFRLDKQELRLFVEESESRDGNWGWNKSTLYFRPYQDPDEEEFIGGQYE